ncbi:hypothetical protein [Brevundimonas nasdae]|uniref:Cellulase n=1 Tax=Brevundimonas nasdae TaxID=172043 RepID=A0ABX8TGH8_9CAUL|nr:hypothetical protein [Brevundimonas nasdae]QYC10331.1 hypothetical protein KWG56_17595 [Brevundimonas nasdae]QYC13119.1 hypothetical protein KWG63_12915 [Brevundimonas nasdae]
MSGIAKYLTIGAAALAIATPAAAESWAQFSSNDQTLYVIDLDTLTPVDGIVSAHMGRVPAKGDASDLSYDTEVVLMRCADGQSKPGEIVTYGPDGAETDRYTDEGPWGASGGVYESIKHIACENALPATTPYPTIAALIAAKRGH